MESPYNGAFERLDEETAYWLGFIWADGSIGIYGRGRQFNIGLQGGDRYQVERLVKFLGFPVDRVNDRNGTSHFQANSVDLFSDLWDWGVRPNKSKSIDEIHCKQEYMDQFVRGLFDGDGSIGVYERSGGRSVRPRFSFYGKMPVVKLVKNHIESEAGVELQKISKKNEGVFGVGTASRKNVHLIFEILYGDGGPFLKRKRESFNKALELEPFPDPGYEKYNEEGRPLVEITCGSCGEVCWKRADQAMRSDNSYCSRECALKVARASRNT